MACVEEYSAKLFQLLAGVQRKMRSDIVLTEERLFRMANAGRLLSTASNQCNCEQYSSAFNTCFFKRRSELDAQQNQPTLQNI